MEAQQIQKHLERIAEEAKGNIEKMSAEVKELKAANQDLIQKNEGLAARFQEFEQSALTTARPGTFGRSKVTKSLGEQFAESDSFKAFVNRESKTATFTTSSTVKNLVNAGAGDSNSTEYPTHPQRDPRLGNDPRRRLRLLEALPTVQMTSAVYEWVGLDGYQNAADEQELEGDPKAQAVMPNDLNSVRAATVAHWLPVSEQALQDTPQLAAQIESLLRYGVQSKAEKLIVAGNGIIQGLQEIGTAFVGETGESMEVAISAAEAEMDVVGWEGSHVILHPRDWHKMRTRRRGASDEAFVVGSWMNPPSLNAWGLQVVTTPSVTQGTSIVLDASQTPILDRMSVVVEAFRQDATNVRENIVTIRAEARLAFACFASTAVRLVSTV